MNRVKKYLIRKYNWYSSNIQKIIFVVGLYYILSYFVGLPYINLSTLLFSFLPYFFDWIAILILFKPKKELILKVGLLLFTVDYFFALVRLNSTLEILGEVSYLMIGTYVILSLRELRTKNT
ncbi:MAG: hypothetical protein M1268_04040 [Patescibacteria group bacterium]|nr:hypothetical protein [Patescibacteria group bacterium]